MQRWINYTTDNADKDQKLRINAEVDQVLSSNNREVKSIK